MFETHYFRGVAEVVYLLHYEHYLLKQKACLWQETPVAPLRNWSL